jgi:hypothetical protein
MTKQESVLDKFQIIGAIGILLFAIYIIAGGIRQSNYRNCLIEVEEAWMEMFRKYGVSDERNGTITVSPKRLEAINNTKNVELRSCELQYGKLK